MTTTIEVIFTGLMLLSQPEGDGKAVVAFPKDDDHELKLVLLQGRAECGPIVIEANGADGKIFPEAADDSLLRLVYPPGGDDRLYWVTGAIGKVPTEETKSYLAWLPSLSSMVLGDSRLRERCRDECDCCAAAASPFFIDRGKISTCHFVHDVSSNQLQLYDLPYGVRRAVSDTFSVTEDFTGELIELKRGVGTGTEKCILKPQNSKIQLFIAHAPVHGSSSVQESHFPRLHRLQRHFYQRMDSSAPTREDLTPRMHDDPCETAIKIGLRTIHPPPFALPPAFPHSPTDCGGATQP